MTRRLWCLLTVLALTAGWLLTPATVELLASVEPTRELAPVPDSVQAWWRSAAVCLTGDSAWRATRVFVGGAPPRNWPAADDPRGPDAGAVNPALNAIWVRRLDPAVVAHQMAHMRLWPAGGHPRFAFPLGGLPLCGLAPVFEQ